MPLETKIEISYSSEDYLPAKQVVTLTGEKRGKNRATCNLKKGRGEGRWPACHGP